MVNHKAFPYRDEAIYVWFERLTDMAPIRPPLRSDQHLVALLDERYEDRAPQDLDVLSFYYDFDYVVRQTPLPLSSAFTVLYEASDWYVYGLAEQRIAHR